MARDDGYKLVFHDESDVEEKVQDSKEANLLLNEEIGQSLKELAQHCKNLYAIRAIRGRVNTALISQLLTLIRKAIHKGATISTIRDALKEYTEADKDSLLSQIYDSYKTPVFNFFHRFGNTPLENTNINTFLCEYERIKAAAVEISDPELPAHQQNK